MDCQGSGQTATQFAGYFVQFTVCHVCGRQFNSNAAGTVRPHK